MTGEDFGRIADALLYLRILDGERTNGDDLLRLSDLCRARAPRGRAVATVRFEERNDQLVDRAREGGAGLDPQDGGWDLTDDPAAIWDESDPGSGPMFLERLSSDGRVAVISAERCPDEGELERRLFRDISSDDWEILDFSVSNPTPDIPRHSV